MRLVLGYVRVSSIDQEQGFGPAAQVERIQRYASDKNLGQPELHYESKSGESVVNRLELHTVLARAEVVVEEGGEAHVIVPGLDRLTRDLIDQESITARCFEKGIRLHSTMEAENDTLDPAFAGDPMRTAIRQFFGIIHQLDRKIIQRRLDGGLAKKAAQGGFTGGRVPFGYRSENQDLVIDPETAPIVRQIFKLRAAGIDLGTIAGILAGKYPCCKKWRKQSVARALGREPLYRQGIYRARGGDQEISRPELRILEGGEQGKEGPLDIDPSQLPEQVRLSTLAVLFDQSEALLRKIISEQGLLVKWKGSSPLVPRQTFERLQKLIQGQV